MKNLLHKRFIGKTVVPGDKSITHRAMIIGSLAKGKTTLYYPLISDDTMDTLKCMEALGANIYLDGNIIKIESNGYGNLHTPKESLYTGNSGTTTRLLIGLIAGLGIDATIEGDNTIAKRPMDRVSIPLTKMGANISLKHEKYPPIQIKQSKLQGITYHMQVASAQVKSAIILAGLGANSKTIIHEQENSRNHTEIMLKNFGADIQVQDSMIILNPKKDLIAQDIVVPGDISSASFLMVLATIIPNSDITIENVSLNETRNGIIQVFKQIGADIEITTKNRVGEAYGDIRVKYKKDLKPFSICGELIPKLIDEIPILTVLALFLNGNSTIRDAKELRFKETDRIEAVTKELEKFNAKFLKYEDGFTIKPTNKLTIPTETLNSYHDHRIIMMLIVMSIKMKTEPVIDDISAISVSYPDFYDDLLNLAK